DLVELGGEDLVVELVGELGARILGRRRHGRVFAGFGGRVLIGIGHVRFHALDIAGFFRLAGLLVLLAVLAVVLALALFGRLVGTLALFGFLVAALFLVGRIGIVQLAFGHQIEVAQQRLGRAREFVLVFVASQ